MWDGIFNLSIWQLVIVALLLTHITIVSVTIYLHRSQAHRALELNVVVSHLVRFWLWLTTGTVTAQWVAVHRLHHARCETEEDPHSPQILGLKRVLWHGYAQYKIYARNPDVVARYSHGTPNDWIENHLYTPYQMIGIWVMLASDLILFGLPGAIVWLVQMMWIPFWAAGVINGIGHFWGYRNFTTADASTNIVPWGIIVGGEELHNNHHAFPGSARLSARRWEFDIGWFYIRVLSLFGLAEIRKLAVPPVIDSAKHKIDIDTVKAVVRHRMHVLANYAQEVIKPVTRSEICHSESGCRAKSKQILRLLEADVSNLDGVARQRLNQLLEQSRNLEIVYQYRKQLKQIWEKTASNQDALVIALQEWCKQAEATGVQALQDFSIRLRGYSVAV